MGDSALSAKRRLTGAALADLAINVVKLIRHSSQQRGARRTG
jgi:hypothetical protein